MAYIFQQISKEGIDQGIKPGTIEARDWFRDRASEVNQVDRNRLMRSARGNTQTGISSESLGSMYMFFYDPKHKETLPYYDKFPLIFPVEKYNDGFLGINMHYLPLVFRARLMDALYDNMSSNKDDMSKLRISYAILNQAAKYKYFKPTVKRYLNGHVRSRFLYIPTHDWDTALFLPTERFAKKNKRFVHDESRKMIVGR